MSKINDGGLRLLGREHYELIEAFERDHHGRFDKEDKSLWAKGHVYQDGRVNDLFVSFRLGYAFARALSRIGGNSDA